MDSKLNLGDSITPLILTRALGKSLPVINPLTSRGKTLFAIGSILKYANSESIIWGSGFISKNDTCKRKPHTVLAVRGPRTARRLKKLYDIDVQTFGDPAILLPLYFPKPIKADIKYDFGIIPHYVDKLYLSENEHLLKNKSYITIDIETDDIQSFIDKISSCRYIYSSTLHGIIISESYGIPARWLKLTENVYGNGFKFYDYYESTDRLNSKNYSLDSVETFKLSDYQKQKLQEELSLMSSNLLQSLSIIK